MITIASIIGTRPQYIKLSAISKEIKKQGLKEIIIDTGQHYSENMSDVFIRELGIPKPDYNLNVGSGTHGYQTGTMIQFLEEILVEKQPDVVLVYGDTNSTLAGALATKYANYQLKKKIRLGHIEAGLRSGDFDMPEELNRVMTDKMSDFNFSPTLAGMFNLRRERLLGTRILSGDIGLEIALNHYKIAVNKSGFMRNRKQKDHILVTLHRPSNVDDTNRFRMILDAFNELNDEHFIFPMHPRTRKNIEDRNIIVPSNVEVIEPLGYYDMLTATAGAKKVITDSGGLQKEAYFFAVPCITLRNTTEWPETLLLDWNILEPCDSKMNLVDTIKNKKPKSDSPTLTGFGTGNTAHFVVDYLNKNV